MVLRPPQGAMHSGPLYWLALAALARAGHEGMSSRELCGLLMTSHSRACDLLLIFTEHGWAKTLRFKLQRPPSKGRGLPGQIFCATPRLFDLLQLPAPNELP